MSTPYLGEIRPVSFDFAPEGWRLCDGSRVMIKDNPGLYSIVGFAYGGDGETYFNLPDLRGRTPVHVSSRGGRSKYLNPGELGYEGGVESVTLTLDQLPSHTHAMQGSSFEGTERSPVGAVFAPTDRRPVYADQIPQSDIVTLNEESVSSVGKGQSHENMQSFTTLNYIIAIDGMYPYRQDTGEYSIYQTLYDGAVQSVELAKHGQTYALDYTLVNNSQDVIRLQPLSASNLENVYVEPATFDRDIQPGEIIEILINCTPSAIGGFSFDMELEYMRVKTDNPDDPVVIAPIFKKRFSVEGVLQEGRIGVSTLTGQRISRDGSDWQGFHVKPDKAHKIGYRIKNTAASGGGNLVLGKVEYQLPDNSKITSVDIRSLTGVSLSPGQDAELDVTYVPSGEPDDGKSFAFKLVIPYKTSDEVNIFEFFVKGSADNGPGETAPAVSQSASVRPVAAVSEASEGAPELTLLATIPYQAHVRQRAVLAGNTVNRLLSFMPPGAIGAYVPVPSVTHVHNMAYVLARQPDPHDLDPEELSSSNVTFTPASPGPYQFQLNWGSFSFQITGAAIAKSPVMTVKKEGGGPIPAGGVDLIDTVPQNQPVYLKYIVSNAGNTDLKLTRYTVVQQANAIASFIEKPSKIKAQSSMEIEVKVTPGPALSSGDPFAATFQIESNDADASPFVFTVTGDVAS